MNGLKRTRFVFVVLLFILFCNYGVLAQDQEGFTVPTTPVLPQSEIHPSLYFSQNEISELQARKTNPNYSEIWQEIQSDAIRFNDTSIGSFDINSRPRAAKTLAFWWVMEQDGAAREKAIQLLTTAFDGIPQTGDKPYDEIYRATWLQNYCAVYDWLFDQLTARQDSVARAKLAAETQFLRDNITSGMRLAPRPHNHRSKPAWAICTAALTLSSHPHAADWLEYGLAQANTVTKAQFTPDGIYKEGGHYWVYSAVNFIPFLWQYLNVSGVNLFPYYQPAFTWTVNVRTGQGWIPNFEDSNVKPAPTHTVAAAYMNTTTDFHSMAFLGNILQWNFLEANVFTRNYTGATNDVTWEIDEFIFYDDSIVPVAPDCSPTVKLDGGQVVFRNRWQGGKGHRYLVFHGPAPGINHDHPDQLSFVIEADDGYVIPDAGYGPDGFSDDRRQTWYTTVQAHNIVTANFYPPNFIPFEQTPPTSHFIDSDVFDFAEKQIDFRSLGAVQQKRSIAFVGEQYWVVTDELQGGDAATRYRLYLHGRGDFTAEQNHFSWTTQKNLYGEAVRLDAFIFPQDAAIHDSIGYISLFWDERAENYIYAEQQKADALFMQILIPGEPKSTVPQVTDKSTAGFIAASVAIEDTLDYFVSQLNNENNTIDSLTTDGNFGWARFVHANLSTIAFKSATSFLVNQNISVTTDRSTSLMIDFHNQGIVKLSSPMLTDTTELKIKWLAEMPSINEVLINGMNSPFVIIDNNTVRIILTPDVVSHIDRHNDGQPEIYFLVENYPNPFRLSTNIMVKSNSNSQFKFVVCNLLGQKIWEKDVDFTNADKTSIFWDGRDLNGSMLPTGIYFGRIIDKNTGSLKIIKMMMLR